MAQLKDLLVSGVSRFVGKLFANEVQLTTLNIPTQSNGSTYGPGDSGGKNVLRSNGTSVYWGNLTIGDVSSGILPVTQGGTGLGTLTSGQALIGNGTGNVTFRAITNNTNATAVTASTNLITANTLYYHKGNSNLTTVGTISSGTWQGSTIGVKYGGTGHTDNWVQYGVVYASATNALTNTAAGVSGQLLKSNATSAPSWVSQADITAGKASALTDLTTTDQASSSATQRYVWISYNNLVTGRPAYTSALTFQTSTGTLTATKFAGDGASLTALNASNITSGTLSADRLATSGVTAASYGPAANASPAHGASFTVPYITVDNKGRITAASTKTITLPSDNNTDVNVTQTNTTTSADYRILFSGTADNTTRTEGARKDGDFLYNPSSNTLTVPTIKVGTYQGTGGGNSTIFVNDWLVSTSDYIVGSTTDKLTSSSSDSEWLKRLLVKLCDTYPDKSAIIFEGKISPNSVGYYKVYIYNTAVRDSTTQLPQYSYGEFRKYNTNHWNFGTSNYSFFCHQIIYNSGSWGISITGSAAKLGTSNVGSTYVPIYLAAGTATQCTSPSLQVNLASTSAANVFAQSPRPGVTGVLGLANGGTGKTNLKDACNALINALDTGSSTLTANDYVITQYVGGGTTTTTYHRRPASAIRVGGLLTGRSLKVALNSTTAVTFDGTADVDNIPVTGTLGIANGGTGKTSAAEIFSALSWNNGTTAGPILGITIVGQSRTATIPSASASTSGVITTGAQNIMGAKTLLSTLTIKGLKATSGTDYGTTLPTSGAEGQVFFQISDETYEIPAGGTTGQALIKNSNTDRDVKWGSIGQQKPGTAKFYPSGSTSTTANTDDAIFNTSVYVQNSVLFGAAWNDYAEYRETTTPVEAGRVVVENGDDTLSLSTERMQPGAEIVSDTFGFAIGQTEKSKTAIAASGRVLAYPHEPRRTYRPGQPVCSGPNGTVSQMTDEEARMYPWCIIGTVSSIPEYDTWGEENIQVKGRIWIRIR